MRYSPFTPLANATGAPSISLPAGRTAQGLPVGIQLVGRMYDEETIISLAAQLEMAHDWRHRIPAMW